MNNIERKIPIGIFRFICLEGRIFGAVPFFRGTRFEGIALPQGVAVAGDGSLAAMERLRRWERLRASAAMTVSDFEAKVASQRAVAMTVLH